MVTQNFSLQSALVISPGAHQVEIQNIHSAENLGSAEKEFWKALADRFRNSRFGEFPESLHHGWKLLENCVAAAEGGQTQLAWAYARGAVHVYNRAECYLRTSNEARHLKDLLDKGAGDEAAKYVGQLTTYREKTSLPHPLLTPQEFLVETEEEVSSAHASFRAAAEDAVHVLSDLQHRASKITALDDEISSVQRKIQTESESLDTLKEETDRAIQDIKTNAQAEATLPRPADFWGARATKHETNERGWLLIFYSLILALGILCAGIWPAITQLLQPIFGLGERNPTGAYLAVLFYVGMPLFLYVWVLRQCFRAYVLNRELAVDAAERVVMMRTYLELTAGNHVGRDDLHLALRALFRTRTDLADDAPPTLVEAISARLRPTT